MSTDTPRTAVQTPAAIRAADPLLTRPEAAAYLGVSRGTLEVWASTGRYNLAYLKVGSRVRYRKSDLDAWMARRTHAAPDAA